MLGLQNKIAIVTGGAGGIGTATATRLIDEGAHVVIADLDATRGKAIASSLGERAQFSALDVTRQDQWQALIDDTVSRLGGLHILVNNAAICIMQALLEQSESDIRNTLNVNLVSVMQGTQIAAPAIEASGGGAIVNLSSAEGLTAVNGMSAYIASKWAVRGFSKAAALELGPRGIRVNSVYPGGVFTPMANPTGLSREAFDESYKNYPAGRGADPEQIASAICFLASDDASHCMGTEIAVDGGMTAGTLADFLPGAPGPR